MQRKMRHDGMPTETTLFMAAARTVRDLAAVDHEQMVAALVDVMRDERRVVPSSDLWLALEHAADVYRRERIAAAAPLQTGSAVRIG